MTKELRARAENAVRMMPRDSASIASNDVERLGHELEVHQIELEMQNESLREAQVRLEESLEQLERVNQELEARVALETQKRLSQELEAGVAARTQQVLARNRELEAEMRGLARNEAERRELETRLRRSERLESLGLLAAGVAHDFNNLLVSVMGNAELLLLTPDVPNDWRETLGLIRRAGRQASDLTRQLLVFGGQSRMSMTAVSLPRVVADGLELLRGRLPATIQVVTRISNDLPAIEADRGQVNQLVLNLVTNAIEALTGERGVITIQTRCEQLDADALAQFQHSASAAPGHFAILQVQDTGSGIDAERVIHIFDPFFTTKFTGRGLGLASVLGIVQGHRGALRLVTHPGEGTSFEVAFPLADPRQESQRPTELVSEAEWTGSGSVLVIDDEDAVRAVVAKMLKLMGFDVTTANGGSQGLELFRSASPPFKCVVLDWMMPGFSGEQVLEALRSLAPELPVLLISGYSADALGTHDEHVVRVQKPMTLSQLRDAMRVVTAEPLATIGAP
jgi:two-component system cell cycle sensor histidine kinase/response regulator CckA